MFSSSKRRGNSRDTSAGSSKAKVRKAVQSAIETLETRVLMTTVTYNVTSNSDTVADVIQPAGVNTYKANTLRAAIDNANLQPFATVIQFTPANFNGGAANTITLSKGVLTLGSATENHSWKIVGNTAKPITISGAGVTEIFSALTTDALEVDNLTLAHGASAQGGAIAALASLTLNGDTFASNTATGGGGAVLSNVGTLTATNCVFTGNSATIAGAVGVLELALGVNPTFTNDTFTGNTASTSGGAIAVESAVTNGKLTITGSKFTGNTAVDYGGAIETYISGATSALATTITGSTFTSNTAVDDDGGAIYDDTGSSLSLGTDVFTSNKATDDAGGAVYAFDKTLTVTNSSFSGDSAYDSGGAVYFDGTGASPTLTVTGSSFTSNKSLDDSGGAIYNYGSTATVATVSNSTFTGNTAYEYGGAIESDGGSTTSLTVTGSTFTNNTAEFDDGGAIDTDDATVAITGSSFTNNKANDDYGGGVYSDATTLTVTNSTFVNDTAYYYGGGIYFDGTDATVTGSTFNGDVANDDYGGGIYAEATSLTVIGSTFTGDTAEYGGGIYAEVDSLTVDSSTFTNNTSKYGGGAIYDDDGGTIAITGSTFTGNQELNDDEGGAIYSDADLLTIDSSSFTGNSAGYAGGALAFYGTDLYVSTSDFTNNSVDGYGGAILADAGGFVGIYDSTFIGNSSALYGGGAVYFEGTDLDVANDTFYQNSTTGTTGGGALYLDGSGTETITDSTIDANTAGYGLGGGVEIPTAATGDVFVYGSIIALNSATGTPDTGNDVSGNVAFGTNDIIGDGTFSNFPLGAAFGNFVGTNLSPVDPLLSAPALNGQPAGSPLTQAIAPTSLAVDNNDDFPVFDQNLQDVTATDERGITRPQGDGYDIGAFELVPAAPADHFVITAPATATKGVAITVVVQALTDLNVPDNTYNDTVTVTSTDATATGLPGPGTLVFTNGVATFMPKLNSVGSFTFTVTDTTPGSPVAPATSSPPTVVTAPVGVIPTIKIGNATAAAPTSGSGTVPMKFAVTLSASPTSAVTVTYGTMQGTASSGHGDYVGVPSATLTFAANTAVLTQYITIQIKKATFPASTYATPYTPSHPGVYFYVLLTNANNAILGTATGIGTITY